MNRQKALAGPLILISCAVGLGCGPAPAGATSDAGLEPDAGSTDAGAGGGDGGAVANPQSIGLGNSCAIPAAPTGINLRQNIIYATMGGQPQGLDIAWPADGGLHPLVVMIHGGGWVSGDKSLFESEIQVLAGQGYASATLNYRLANLGCLPDGGVAPDAGACFPNHFPDAVADVRCAIRWLKANAATFSIDPSRVGVTGGSAGGHLAAMLGTGAAVAELDGSDGGTCPVAGDPSVTAVVSFFGPEDLLHWDPSYWSRQNLADLLVTPTYNSDPALAELASPIDHVTPNSPPFLLLHGTADGTVPYEQSVWMQEALWDAGVPATLVTVPDGGHGFPMISNLPQYQQTSCTFLAFLEAYLQP